MHEETGGPKNSHTTDADQNNRQAESKEYGEEIELQDETIRKILMMFDQQILCETFDEEDTVSELDGSPDFSQAFKDRMRTMVAEKFGQEAAEDGGQHHVPRQIELRHQVDEQRQQQHRDERAHREANADAPPADGEQRHVNQKAEQTDVQPCHAGKHRRDARHAARRDVVGHKERRERERRQQRADRQQQIIPNQLPAFQLEIHLHPVFPPGLSAASGVFSLFQ